MSEQTRRYFTTTKPHSKSSVRLRALVQSHQLRLGVMSVRVNSPLTSELWAMYFDGMSEDYFAAWICIVALISFGIGTLVGGKAASTAGNELMFRTEEEQADEELAKLEREVELMRLKVKAQDLQKQLNM